MKIEDEISSIFAENIDRLTHAMIIEIIDEMLDIICIKLAEDLQCSYETVEGRILMARAKIIKKLEESRKKKTLCH